MRDLRNKIMSEIYSINDSTGEYIAIFILLAWNAFLVMLFVYCLG